MAVSLSHKTCLIMPGFIIQSGEKDADLSGQGLLATSPPGDLLEAQLLVDRFKSPVFVDKVCDQVDRTV